MEETNNTIVAPTISDAENAWVDKALEKFNADPRAHLYNVMRMAQEKKALEEKVCELAARQPEVGLARPDELRGRTSPIWVNPKGSVMIVRLAFRNLLEGGDVTIIPVTVMKSSKGKIFSRALSDNYSRGLAEGLKAAAIHGQSAKTGERLSPDESKKVKTNFTATGALARETISFARPENLEKIVPEEFRYFFKEEK